MNLDGKKVSKSMLRAIIIAQIFSFTCLLALSYHLNVVAKTYKQMESSNYQAIKALQQVQSDLYKHENLLSTYVLSDNIYSIKNFDENMASYREGVESNLTKCQEIFSELDNQETLGQFDELSGAIIAYLNSADIVIDTKQNVSTDVAIFLINNNMAYYISRANDCIDSLQDIAGSNDMITAATMRRLILASKLVFYLGVVGIIIATVICIRYVRRMLDVQEGYMYEAEAANRAKSNFLSSMSHEIRTPINAIIGLNEMIQRESKEKNIVKYSAKIGTSSHSLLSLINDILDYSKIEAGKMSLVCDNYRLDAMLTEIWDLLATRAADKGLSLRFEVMESTPNLLYGDMQRIKQIVINLLTNSVKYTNEGYVNVTVSYTKMDEEHIELDIAVSDSGIGIKDEDRAKLTTAFERIDVHRNNSVEGTGLGLSIVSNLLDMMGSKLEVKSVYNVGSTFSFKVQQTVVDWQQIGAYEPDAYDPTQDMVKGPAFYAPKAKLLVVDDNEVNRMVMSELLKQNGVQIDLAEGGQRSIDMAYDTKYDLILMDHRMPDVDGIEALHGIRHAGKNMATPVIIVTANSSQELDDFYKKEGFATFIGKPVDPKELELTVKEYLSEELFENIPDEIFSQEISEDNSTEKKLPKDYETAQAANGGQELYEKIVTKFVESADNSMREICGLKESGDISNYTVKVHALKSNARMLGANELSELAKELEACGDKADIETINAKTDELLGMYKAVVEEFTELFNLNAASQKEKVDKDIISNTLDEIIAANADFDFDKIDKLTEYLGQVELPENIASLMPELKDAAFNMNQDAIVSISEQMKGGLA